MITANEEGLIIEMQCVRLSITAKRRVQKEMPQEEKDKISTVIEALEELEKYYVKNR